MESRMGFLKATCQKTNKPKKQAIITGKNHFTYK